MSLKQNALAQVTTPSQLQRAEIFNIREASSVNHLLPETPSVSSIYKDMPETPGISRVGSRAICTFTAEEWIKKSPNSTTQKKSRKITRDTVYPIFLTMLEHTHDPFWKEKINKAALGSFPRGLSFTTASQLQITEPFTSDNILIYKKAGKVSETVISDVDSKLGCEQYIKFLKRILSLESPLEREISTQRDITASHRLRSTPSESLSISAVLDYINRLCLEFKSTKTSKEELKLILVRATTSHVIPPHMIHWDKGKILAIEGVFYNPLSESFYLDPNLTQTTRKEIIYATTRLKNKNTIPQYASVWKKILRQKEKSTADNTEKRAGGAVTAEEDNTYNILDDFTDGNSAVAAGDADSLCED